MNLSTKYLGFEDINVIIQSIARNENINPVDRILTIHNLIEEFDRRDEQ